MKEQAKVNTDTTPEFFEMLKERLAPRLTKQTTNWRGPLSVGLKIATTLKYLATGETYTSLYYQFRSGKASISQSAGPSLMSSCLST